jgi:hypothetical protein
MISSVENNSCESIWVPRYHLLHVLCIHYEYFQIYWWQLIFRTIESTCNKSVTSSDDTTNSNTQIPRHHDEGNFFCFLFDYFTWLTFIWLIECDTDQETDRLLGAQRSDDRGFFDEKVSRFYDSLFTILIQKTWIQSKPNTSIIYYLIKSERSCF